MASLRALLPLWALKSENLNRVTFSLNLAKKPHTIEKTHLRALLRHSILTRSPFNLPQTCRPLLPYVISAAGRNDARPPLGDLASLALGGQTKTKSAAVRRAASVSSISSIRIPLPPKAILTQPLASRLPLTNSATLCPISKSEVTTGR